MHRFDRGAAKRAQRLRARTQRGHGAVARRRGLHPRPPEDDSQSDTGKFDVPTESEMEDDNEIKMSTLGDKSLWTRRPNTVVHRATFKNDTIVVKRLRTNILQSTPSRRKAVCKSRITPTRKHPAKVRRDRMRC